MVSHASAQAAPPLGQAGSFVVLAGSTVTNSGPTNVLGDVGVSPGSAVVGFPPGVVAGGTIHLNDPVALLAQSDAATAYNTLAGEASTATLTGQDLGGLTLQSGVYVFSTSAQLTGTLTLDAQGDPGAVFVFQIGSTLTTASGSRVVVINGGSDCNVFWQVGSSATFGTTTQFVGNILVMASITFNTGASVSGRALARTGAVTLDTNDATICSSCGVLTIAPASLLPMTIGTPYSQTLTASGGTAPYSFAVMGGALPPGISLTPAGTLSGTPTASGSFSFTVRATDALGCVGDVSYTVIVNIIACGTITVSPTVLVQPVPGTPYLQTLTASGGVAPYTFTIGSGALPSGLNLATDGTISGTPTATGSFTFTVMATDSADCPGSQSYTLTGAVTATSAPTLSLWSELGLLAALVAAAGWSANRTRRSRPHDPMG
ncbi:MAG: ice-binding family protein [Dokdonella sp.]